MNDKHILFLTWGKAYDEVYCHHASIFIPYNSCSLFDPDIVRIGVTIRSCKLEKKVKTFADRKITRYLRCNSVDGGIIVPINSSSIIDALGLNSWTTLKDGSRGFLKEFPVNLYYKIDTDDEVVLPFNYECLETPNLLSENRLSTLNNGDKVDSVIKFNF